MADDSKKHTPCSFLNKPHLPTINCQLSIINYQLLLLLLLLFGCRNSHPTPAEATNDLQQIND
ncbi:MAG: hypothetical protein K2I27_02865, partial [Bacteroides sp.]|nr:hypothetical protein [Bacteroides sp.]